MLRRVQALILCAVVATESAACLVKFDDYPVGDLCAPWQAPDASDESALEPAPDYVRRGHCSGNDGATQEFTFPEDASIPPDTTAADAEDS